MTASGINRALAQAALAIADTANAADALREFLSQPRRLWPVDDQLAESIGSLNFYWTGKASQRLFILRRLEESYGHKEHVDWDTTIVQIEHILPQTPTPEWLALLEPDVEPGETPADLHQRIVHRLGNLTLTGYNPDLSNKPFPEKRALLAISKFSMSTELAQQPTWGLPQIEARGKAVADRAAEIWPGRLQHTNGLPSQTNGRSFDVSVQHSPQEPGPHTATSRRSPGSTPSPSATTWPAQGVANAWRVLRSDGAVSFRIPMA